MKQNTVFVAFAMLVALSAPAFSQEKDTIKLKKEAKPREVQIIEESYKSIACQIGSAKTQFLWKEIETVEYGNRPKDLAAGVSAVKKSEYAEGLKLLDKVRGQKDLRPIFKQQALFYYAQAAESEGKIEEAIKAYQQLLGEFKQSRYLNKANDRIVACLVAQKKFDEAQKVIAAAKQEATAAKLDDELIREFDLLECTLLENSGKLAEAANAYEKLAGAAGSNATIADLARIGAARAAVAKGGDAGKARATYDQVISNAKEDTSPIVMAAAYNGLGEVQLAEARKDKKAEKAHEALFSVLRGYVVYFPGDNDRTGEYERSMFLSAQAFDLLASLTTDEAAKKQHQDRAKEKKEELSARFPLSPYRR